MVTMSQTWIEVEDKQQYGWDEVSPHVHLKSNGAHIDMMVPKWQRYHFIVGPESGSDVEVARLMKRSIAGYYVGPF